MPKLHPEVVETKPNRIDGGTEFAVLYIRASDNIEAIDCANQWASANDFERARELTLGRARKNNQDFYVARCYRRVEGER
jgi:hypothetical protein